MRNKLIFIQISYNLSNLQYLDIFYILIIHKVNFLVKISKYVCMNHDYLRNLVTISFHKMRYRYIISQNKKLIISISKNNTCILYVITNKRTKLRRRESGCPFPKKGQQLESPRDIFMGTREKSYGKIATIRHRNQKRSKIQIFIFSRPDKGLGVHNESRCVPRRKLTQKQRFSVKVCTESIKSRPKLDVAMI